MGNLTNRMTKTTYPHSILCIPGYKRLTKTVKENSWVNQNMETQYETDLEL